jgi:hypothetical protein
MTKDIFDVIITIAQFDLIDTETYIFKGMLNMEIPESHQEYHQEAFDLVGYGNSFMILNLGTLYLIFLIFVLEGILLFICKPIFWVNKRLRNWSIKLKKALYWNSFLRLIMEASLDLAITTLYNVSIFGGLYEDGNWDWWKPELPFFWMNSITTVASSLTLFLLPPFILIYYLRKFERWEDDKFENSMGSVLDGLSKDKKFVIFYPVFFMIRRTVFAA